MIITPSMTTDVPSTPRPSLPTLPDPELVAALSYTSPDEESEETVPTDEESEDLVTPEDEEPAAPTPPESGSPPSPLAIQFLAPVHTTLTVD